MGNVINLFADEAAVNAEDRERLADVTHSVRRSRTASVIRSVSANWRELS